MTLNLIAASHIRNLTELYYKSTNAPVFYETSISNNLNIRINTKVGRANDINERPREIHIHAMIFSTRNATPRNVS